MATTSWWLSGDFRRTYPKVRLTPDALVTKDERILCAAAFSACLNLGVEIIAEFLGPRAALSCARVMLVDVNRTTQLPYANLQERIIMATSWYCARSRSSCRTSGDRRSWKDWPSAPGHHPNAQPALQGSNRGDPA